MKKYIKVVFMAIFMLAMGYSIHLSSKSKPQLSSLALENIQALASSETDGSKFIAFTFEGGTTYADNGYSVTICTEYTTRCMAGGNDTCTAGNSTNCTTIKKG